MSYVPIVTQPPRPSRETRELADRVSRVLLAYQRDHPSVTAAEVRQALALAQRSTRGGAGLEAPALVIALLLGVAAMLGLVAFYFFA